MQSIKALLIVAVLALSSLGQSIEVKPFVADLAKSVKVEQLPESVAVIFTDRIGTRAGAYLQVTSEKKWATPLLDGVEITQTKIPGEWILFAAPGRYRVLLAEFDPETGPKYTYHTVVIEGKKPEDPQDPVDPPPPPIGDFAAIKQVAKQAADAMNDPTTRAALLAVYRSAVANSDGKSYDEMLAAVTSARAAALRVRERESTRTKEWAVWLGAVDVELKKAVKPGDVAAYIEALKAIVAGLQ